MVKVEVQHGLYPKISFRKLPVQVRLKGLKPTTRSFSTKTKAKAFAREIESNSELARKMGMPVSQVITFSHLVELIYCILWAALQYFANPLFTFHCKSPIILSTMLSVSSIARCAYLPVIVVLLWPSKVLTSNNVRPCFTRFDAAVCRKSWNRICSMPESCKAFIHCFLIS